jgi:hypothetical protein
MRSGRIVARQRDASRLVDSVRGAGGPARRERTVSAATAPAFAAAAFATAFVGPELPAIAVPLTLTPAEPAPAPPADPVEKCEDRLAHGSHAEAIDVCVIAWRASPTPAVGKLLVRARMAGPALPTADDLAGAMVVAQDLRTRFPQDPASHAARCDIAERIGDVVMLEKCASDLERVAPGHPDTARALAALRARRPVWLAWTAVILTALATLGTLAHAGWRAARRLLRRAPSVAAASAALVGLLAGVGAPARAADPATAYSALRRAPSIKAEDLPQISKYKINDKDPSSDIPNEEKRAKNPLEFGYWLQDLAAKGQTASQQGDHVQSAKYFLAMAKAVPDRPISFRRLCEEYEAAGDRDQAIAACGSALYLDGVILNDYTHYLQLIIGKPGSLSPKEISSMTSVLQHLRDDPTGRDVADVWQCEVALRLNDVLQLEQCSAALTLKAPNDPQTILYSWSLAVQQQDFNEAHALLAKAKAAKMKPESLERMERETALRESRHFRSTLWVLLAALLGAVALGAGGWLLWQRRRAPPADTTTPPATPPDAGTEPATIQS